VASSPIPAGSSGTPGVVGVVASPPPVAQPSTMKLPKAGIGMDRVAPVLNWKYLQQWARNEHGGRAWTEQIGWLTINIHPYRHRYFGGVYLSDPCRNN